MKASLFLPATRDPVLLRGRPQALRLEIIADCRNEHIDVPLMCVVNDLNQRYVMDLGLPGPDAGKGGKHVILPPNYKGEVSRRLLSLSFHTE